LDKGSKALLDFHDYYSRLIGRSLGGLTLSVLEESKREAEPLLNNQFPLSFLRRGGLRG